MNGLSAQIGRQTSGRSLGSSEELEEVLSLSLLSSPPRNPSVGHPSISRAGPATPPARQFLLGASLGAQGINPLGVWGEGGESRDLESKAGSRYAKAGMTTAGNISVTPSCRPS